ncbi:MAG TPA: hypothetical protein VGM88_28910 [Kofleriaceae bacterium]|jgi:hypothetical protein
MRLALVAGLLFATACTRGNAQECEQACRNFGTLAYWDKTDKEIEALPPEQRVSMRKQKLSEFDNKMETEVDGCVSQCVSANNKEQTKCMIDAKTADQVRLCTK